MVLVIFRLFSDFYMENYKHGTVIILACDFEQLGVYVGYILGRFKWKHQSVSFL